MGVRSAIVSTVECGIDYPLSGAPAGLRRMGEIPGVKLKRRAETSSSSPLRGHKTMAKGWIASSQFLSLQRANKINRPNAFLVDSRHSSLPACLLAKTKGQIAYRP